MAGYIGANTSSVTNNQNAAERRKKFTFTANTTVLSGLNFAPNKIHIFHNGIRLVKDTDFTEATDGKSVTLTNAAQAGDEVVAITFAQDPASSSYTDADVDAHLLTAGVTLDATNDRLGIGTTTPSVPFDVTKAGGGNFVANFQNTTNATPYGIHVKDAASGANGYPLFQVTNDAGSNTYFRVDSGTGRVTTPNQPSFQVKLSSQSNAGSGAIVTGWGDIHNIGGHFASNRFTAPVAGRYVISYTGLHNTGQGYYGRAYLYKNGSYIFDGLNDNSAYGGYVRLSWTLVVDLAANDYLQIYADSNNSSHYVYGHYTHWSGHLLG